MLVRVPCTSPGGPTRGCRSEPVGVSFECFARAAPRPIACEGWSRKDDRPTDRESRGARPPSGGRFPETFRAPCSLDCWSVLILDCSTKQCVIPVPDSADSSRTLPNRYPSVTRRVFSSPDRRSRSCSFIRIPCEATADRRVDSRSRVGWCRMLCGKRGGSAGGRRRPRSRCGERQQETPLLSGWRSSLAICRMAAGTTFERLGLFPA